MERLNLGGPLVRPRVTCPKTGEPVLLEDLVLEDLSANPGPRIFYVQGSPGSGKSTAARYLESQLRPEFSVHVVDADAQSTEPAKATDEIPRCIIITSDTEDPTANDKVLESGMNEELQGLVEGSFKVRNGVVYLNDSRLSLHAVIEKLATRFTLTPWNRDDVIEYLLSIGPDECKSVMSRITQDATTDCLLDRPVLWSLIINRMLSDDTACEAKTILRQTVDQLVPDAQHRLDLGRFCTRYDITSHSVKKSQEPLPNVDPTVCKLLRYQPVSNYLSARFVLDVIKQGLRRTKYWLAESTRTGWAKPWPPNFLETVHDLSDDTVVDRLLEIVHSKKGMPMQPNATSLLVRLNPNWKLHEKQPKNLKAASLQSIVWEAVDLRNRDIDDANFARGRMPVARMSGMEISGAIFLGTDLDGADIANARVHRCRFDRATLNAARMRKAKFIRCGFQFARFVKADLSEAELRVCDLTGADFTGANFTKAQLANSTIEGADFRKAIFKGARLHGHLHDADFRDAVFNEADMQACNMEYMELPAPDFRHAVLQDALLTGTHFPHADFCGADLRRTGLAGIDWECADLRHADLRRCTFHMGSSRSGLLFSPHASEGTRTGFYTDTYNEQDYKPVEEIRKASLRGADLRGASIQGVDFYLVDLRDALYDAKYHEQLVNCGAILS